MRIPPTRPLHLYPADAALRPGYAAQVCASGTARYPNRMDAHERNERTLARALGELIPQLKDPRIPLVVTVERVKLNSDYSQAKVLVSTLNEADMPDFQDALARASGFLQRELASDLDLRRTPRLVFTDNPLEVL